MMPGRRTTTIWENGRAGRLKRSEVGAGAVVGVVMRGQPVGITPKSWGRAIAILIWVFLRWQRFCRRRSLAQLADIDVINGGQIASFSIE